MELWPYDHQKVDKVTLWRWLDRAVKEGLLKQSGLGRQHAPFGYLSRTKLWSHWLPN